MCPDVKLNLWVLPGAKRTEITGEKEGAITVKVAAPPVEGKANEELIRFLAEKLGLKRGSVTIESGRRGRRKIVRVEGMDKKEVLRILFQF